VPALARRLRAELQRLLDEAGPELDALLAELEAERAARPSGQERREALQLAAERLSFSGKLAVAK
jgi:siroheme synthase (precorrin-2 oxidase/ferrochelatase)